MNKIGFPFRNIAVVVIGLVLVAACTGPAQSDLEVSSAWARAATAPMEAMMGDDTAASEDMAADPEEESAMSMPNGSVSAAYMTIQNKGAAGDRLLAVTTESANIVEIHTVEVENDVARMRPLPDGLEIPANSTVNLEPGGYHIMLMALQEDLVAGDVITLVLNFSSGKTLSTEAEIQEP